MCKSVWGKEKVVDTTCPPIDHWMDASGNHDFMYNLPSRTRTAKQIYL